MQSDEEKAARAKWLEELKADDVVVERHSGGYGADDVFRKLTIERCTPTQIIIGQAKYRRKDGRRMGEASGRLEPLTDEIRTIWRRTNLKNRIYAFAQKVVYHKVDFSKLSEAELISLDTAIKAVNQEAPSEGK